MKKTTPLVVIKGAGDLASGCAVRLARAGFAVVMTELPAPTAVRRTVCFSEAAVEGKAAVEGLRAKRADNARMALRVAAAGDVAVLVDPDGEAAAQLAPLALVDARMAKRNLGTVRDESSIVIGLGPGFIAGRDVDAVIETNRGHDLGQVILKGTAEPNTGVPGEIGGAGTARLLRSPASGKLRCERQIGDRVKAGQRVGSVAGEPVLAMVGGVIRGFLRHGSVVHSGQKIGDVDPRARPEHCATVSDKARAVAGGVLEAILYLSRTKKPASIRFKLPITTRPGRRPGGSAKAARASS